MAHKCYNRKGGASLNGVTPGGKTNRKNNLKISNPTDSIYVKPDEASQAYGVIEEGMYPINLKGVGMYPINLKGVKLTKSGHVMEQGQDRSLGLDKKGVVRRGGGGYEINANQDLPKPVKKLKK